MRYLFAREHVERLPWSYSHAAYYPEAVGVLSVLASSFWLRMAISKNRSDRERFYRQVASNGLTNGQPEWNRPLRNWIETHRNTRPESSIYLAARGVADGTTS